MNLIKSIMGIFKKSETLEQRVLNRGWCTINEYQKLKVKRGK